MCCMGEPILYRALPATLLLALGLLASASLADDYQFNRDVRPILSDNCFQCHGPDRATREADLRLDDEASALADRDGAPVIVPGDSEASELIARITAEDPDVRMPPPDSGKQLTANQIKILRGWVDQGAKWEKHWAFIAPQSVDPPAVQHRDRVRNPIDQFVFAELERRGLAIPPTAEKRRLIRRVSQDLIGLPPTEKEIQEFLDDTSADAYEKLVDRLLESPHYGERMAMQWLDAARYADSHGYSLDRRRVMWPWRDWVIEAYNANMPFDQFVIEQLAGDLLPDATVAQQVATGFNRNHPIQSEGGVIDEEYRVETVVDRVETTSAVFLGLTMGCARCHDHKYESISQREFYQFFAFFNNVPESAHVGNRDNQADRPFIKALSREQRQRRGQMVRRIALLKRQLAEERTKSPAERTTEKMAETTTTVWVDDRIPDGAQAFGNGSGPQEFRFVTAPDHPVLLGEKSSFRKSQGLGQHGFQNASDGLKISESARLFAYVFVDPADPPQQIMLQWNVDGSWEHRAYWGDNQIDWGKDKTSSRRRLGDLPEAGKWVRLEVDPAKVGIQPGQVVNGWAFTQFGGTLHWDNAGMEAEKLTGPAAEIAELEQQLAKLDVDAPTVMVMSEMSPRRKTYILARGQYDRPTEEEVQANVPAALGALPADLPADRLALARWLVSADNPLTARVAVNRYWQLFFGDGLVSTPEDFGTQGAVPSYPQLLDWLAVEFRRSGWNVKQFQKQIVMSATYRASSRVTPELLELDPQNRLLARGPRFRLAAELIRDHALATSGLLVRDIGGPSVRPYQPPGLWDDVVYGNAPRFQQDHGEKLYRRSLYTYWKRSVPPPNLQALDAPSREACTLRRSRTNTPQAALVLMNDPTFVEAARVLAPRALREAPATPAGRLDFLFRTILGRPPQGQEAERVLAAWRDLKSSYEKDPRQARELLGVGEAPRAELSPAEAADEVELATLAAVANALYSTAEAITRN